jgi:hypothetical protein
MNNIIIIMLNNQNHLHRQNHTRSFTNKLVSYLILLRISFD